MANYCKDDNTNLWGERGHGKGLNQIFILSNSLKNVMGGTIVFRRQPDVFRTDILIASIRLLNHLLIIECGGFEMAGKTSKKSATSQVKETLDKIGSAAHKDIAALKANHKKEIAALKRALEAAKKKAEAEVKKLKKMLEAHTRKAAPKKAAAKKAAPKKAAVKKTAPKKAAPKKAATKKAATK